MNAKQNYIPIDALCDESCGPNLECDPRPALHAADVIMGVDVMSGHEFIVFGRKTLKEVVRKGKAPPVKMARIGIDQETDELERLIALVKTIKGSHDYQTL